MQNEKVPAAMQDNVTQSDLRWRKRFHEVTGYVDMDMALAKLIARHRVASTTTQSETVQKLVEFIRGLECECDSYHEFRCGRCLTLASHRESQP